MPFFIHEGKRLHYTLEGDGPILLFVHGLGGNAENWILQRKSFSRRHRVVALDLPGHGRSEGRDVGFRRYWQAILALCDHLGAETVAICGLSKGARASLMFAARRPERVSHIAVVNAFVHLRPADRAERLNLYDLLLESDGGRAWANRLLKMMGVSNYPAIVRGFQRSLGSIDPVHIRTIFRELLAFDQRPELANVQCPVLLLRGERDGFVPSYCVEELGRLLPLNFIARMPACGHLPYLEMPTHFDEILSNFLEN